MQNKFVKYLNAVKRPYTKLCRLRFLQPDGSTAFAIDNNAKRQYSRAFLSDGNITVNLQNGVRRTANITLSNLDGTFDFNVNRLWFGKELALDEGIILPDGSDFYIQQGVFLLKEPTESVVAANRTAQYQLVDKWANLDGSLLGSLEGTYEVPVGTNIFEPIVYLLKENRGNGLPLDAVTPVFTEYYNKETQKLPDGTTVPVTNTPYTLTIDNETGSVADVILGLASMLNAWVGYDSAGALRIDPSQDDILDLQKPVAWEFSMSEGQLLSPVYSARPEDVFNDVIVTGEQLDNNYQPCGRAQNFDPSSDTNVNLIGRKTKRMNAAGYGTVRQCQDRAVWELKRTTALQKTVAVSCTQLFHIKENELITIRRTDKPGAPVERHLVTGFSRPLNGTQPMQINAVAVSDFPMATVTKWPV